MQMMRLPLPKATRPSSEKPLLLTNRPRVQAAFCSISAVERVQACDPGGLAVPFGFQQICVTSEPEAAVDLFAPQAECSWAARPKASAIAGGLSFGLLALRTLLPIH